MTKPFLKLTISLKERLFLMGLDESCRYVMSLLVRILFRFR